jgi:lysophospholipase L1-like esterase
VTAHGKREARLQQGNADVLLIGDSITAGWSKHPDLLQKVFGDRQVVNLGHPADKTENILWRIRNHSFDKVSPGVAIVLAGTNNSNNSNNDDHTPDQIASGVQAIVAELRNKLPQTKILLLGIFPRGSSGQRLELKSGRTAAQMNPQWGSGIACPLNCPFELHCLNGQKSKSPAENSCPNLKIADSLVEPP